MKNFKQLISSIEGLHAHLQASAANAVNQALTIRNWLIGYYIVEFEQNGDDRAEYGDGLIEALAQELSGIKGVDRRSLFRFRQFYLYYPQIAYGIKGALTPDLKEMRILENLTRKNLSGKMGTPSPQLADSSKVGTMTPQFDPKLFVPGDKLLTRLSYSHFELLLKIDNPLKRSFFEIECIKGTWSIRELKRQINSRLFERSGLSRRPEKLLEMVQQKNEPQAPKDIIKNIYAFEFLGLGTREIVEESDLETALLNHLQQFILELGNGFCFEARQKRILIGENYYFIDLLFYHRILKCHILLELKIGAFEHGDIGQLNTYLNYFKAEVSDKADNPPVGILLVAEKDNALVKYATAGMDKNLFVQKYMLQLPSTKQLSQYIEKELKELK